MKKLLIAVALALPLVLTPWSKVDATVSNTATETDTALGNGVTTSYTIGFVFQDNDDVKVYLQDESVSPYTQTLLVYGTGAGKYTITGGDPGTTVVAGTAPTTSQRLVIKRVMGFTQTVDYTETNAFPAEDHEMAMDKMTMLLQQLNSEILGMTLSSLPNLASGHIFVGNGSGVPTDVAVTGDVSITSGGVTSITRSTTPYQMVVNSSTGALSGLTPGNAGDLVTSNGTSWVSAVRRIDPRELINLGLAASVGSNALTVALKQSDGSTNPSTGAGSVSISFRNSTAATGGFSTVLVTGASSIVVPSSATLGQVSAVSEPTYIYGQSTGTAIQLCVTSNGYLDEGSLVTSTAVSASATGRSTVYCSAAVSGPVRLLGRVTSTQATAGTWATTPSEVALAPFQNDQVIGSSTVRLRHEFIYVAGACSSSPCTVTASSGNWFSNVTRTSSGLYLINFRTGAFSVPPVCVCSSSGTSAHTFCETISPGNTNVTITTSDTTSSRADTGFSVVCDGAK